MATPPLLLPSQQIDFKPIRAVLELQWPVVSNPVDMTRAYMDPTFVQVFADILTRGIAVANTHIAIPDSDEDYSLASPECFETQHPEIITLANYIWRFVAYSGFSPMVYYIALYLIDKAVVTGKLALTFSTIHKVFASAAIIASKIHDDHNLANTDLAQVAGIQVDALNAMEMQFFAIVGFSAYVTHSELAPYYAAVAKLADQLRALQAELSSSSQDSSTN